MNTKRLYPVLLALVLCFNLMAETPSREGNKKAEQQQQLSLLTERYVRAFSLSGEQAQLFRTTFLSYNKAMKDIKNRYREVEVQNPTEQQQEEAILRRFDRQRAILDVRESYYNQLRKVLSPSEIQRIYDDEKLRKEQINPQQ